MVSEADFEQGRKELEALLTREVSETQEVRADDVRYTHFFPDDKNWRTRDVSDEELRKKETEMKQERRLIYIRKTSPVIVGNGQHQLVLGVGNDLVAKVSRTYPYFAVLDAREAVGFKLVDPDLANLPEEEAEGIAQSKLQASQDKLEEFDFYELGERQFGRLSETVGILREEGFDIQPIKLYVLKWEGNKVVVSSECKSLPFMTPREVKEAEKLPAPNIYLTSDLRENGRYAVVEFDEEAARSLVNGEDLIAQFDIALEKLISYEQNFNYPFSCNGKYLVLRDGKYGMQWYDSQTRERITDEKTLTKIDESYQNGETKRMTDCVKFSYDTHIGDKSALGAMRKMFLLQVPVDKREEGKLVIGDLDHVYLYRS